MNTDQPSEEKFLQAMKSVQTWIDTLPEQTKPQRYLDEELLRYSRIISQNAPCVLESPTAQTEFFDYVRAVDGYTKKGRDMVTESWIGAFRQIMHNCTFFPIEHDEQAEPSQAYLSTALKCMEFILERVDTKPARTERVAQLRARLWDILSRFMEKVLVEEVLDAAMRIMASKKHKVDERVAALSLATLFIAEDDANRWQQIRKVVDAAGPHKHDFAMAAYDEDIDMW